MTRWSVERRPSDRAVTAAVWGSLIACSVVGAVVGGAVLEAWTQYRKTRRWAA